MTRPLSRNVLRPGEPVTAACNLRTVRGLPLLADAADDPAPAARRELFVAHLASLAECIAVRVLAYGLHEAGAFLVLGQAPEVAAGWSDAEVSERWLALHPARTQESVPRKMTPSDRERRIASDGGVGRWRPTLADASFFIKHLHQRVAMKLNRLDGEDGAFWSRGGPRVELCTPADTLAACLLVERDPRLIACSLPARRGEDQPARPRSAAFLDDSVAHAVDLAVELPPSRLPGDRWLSPLPALPPKAWPAVSDGLLAAALRPTESPPAALKRRLTRAGLSADDVLASIARLTRVPNSGRASRAVPTLPGA